MQKIGFLGPFCLFCSPFCRLRPVDCAVQLSMQEVLQPAIELAETGFPVQEVTAMGWKAGETWSVCSRMCVYVFLTMCLSVCVCVCIFVPKMVDVLCFWFKKIISCLVGKSYLFREMV